MHACNIVITSLPWDLWILSLEYRSSRSPFSVYSCGVFYYAMLQCGFQIPFICTRLIKRAFSSGYYPSMISTCAAIYRPFMIIQALASGRLAIGFSMVSGLSTLIATYNISLYFRRKNRATLHPDANIKKERKQSCYSIPRIQVCNAMQEKLSVIHTTKAVVVVPGI